MPSDLTVAARNFDIYGANWGTVYLSFDYTATNSGDAFQGIYAVALQEDNPNGIPYQFHVWDQQDPTANSVHTSSHSAQVFVNTEGDYFFSLVADPWHYVSESDETNNQSQRAKLTFTNSLEYNHVVGGWVGQELYELYTYGTVWSQAWHVGWYYGWGQGWHVGWYKGWGVGWNVGWHNTSGSWEYGWHVGWNVGWHMGWNAGWYKGWHVGWNYGWVGSLGWELIDVEMFTPAGGLIP
ncbi:MAG: CARDB domain-containing protein [Pseudomonadota bacterium]